jgi:hypothetical protein
MAVGLRDRMRRLEKVADEEMMTLVCRECGEELRVRQGIELDLVADAWAQEQKKRGQKDYGEPPEDVHLINYHPCNWTALREKYTGERLFRWGSIDEA